MDIKVITRHAPSNYGSLLQSIATIKVIERLGHECTIINYIRDDERGLKAILATINQKRNWNDKLLNKVAYILLRFPIEYLAQLKFDHMRNRHLKLTNRYHSKEQLSELQADIFMTGSDQVWGPVLTKSFDDAYFLSFVKRNAKKVAYAASFGRTEFNSTIIESYRALLSTYNEIAVREDNAVDLLKNWNIPCKGQVLDPTLLLTNKEWSEYIKKERSDKYILVYQLHNNKALNNYAKDIAAKTKLPLIRVSPSLHQIKRGGKLIYLPNLSDFLSYIKNCTYFITDSFHGTAFALNFNKQFIEILPNNKTGGRNLSILNLTGLENRIVTNFTDFSILDQSIDYNRVNKILDRERCKSVDILKQLCKL